MAPHSITAGPGDKVRHAPAKGQRQAPSSASRPFLWAANTTKIAFFGPKSARAGEKESVFQVLAWQIRYLADQWNFTADQRISNAVTTELQQKFGGLKNKGMCGHFAA